MKKSLIEKDFPIYWQSALNQTEEGPVLVSPNKNRLFVEEDCVIRITGMRKKRLHVLLARHKSEIPTEKLPNGKRLICLWSMFSYVGNSLRLEEARKTEESKTPPR